jgi:membrane-bound lytic murein transglycosylase A
MLKQHFVFHKILTFTLIFIISSCARAPLKSIKDSMRPTSSPPAIIDSLGRESFFSALKKHIEVMKKSGQVQDPMIFGKTTIKKAEYVAALERILDHEADWLEWITINFDFYEVYGRDDWSKVMVTGYYEPRVKGSLVETAEFSQALYTAPNDLVTVNLKKFAGKFSKGENLGLLQGRVENGMLVPYYDRSEIDELKKVKDKSSVLAWVDPVDAFFIQIQGSGVVEFSNGESMRVGYDGQNGHSYMAIGKTLTHAIPMEQMSMQKIKLHLNSLTVSERQKIMNRNPSYVFFKKLDSLALTYAGMEVHEGRTIATDLHLFPKGAMAFLDIEEPEFTTPTQVEATLWYKRPRLVFDQDTGGAIRGGGRVDLYFGQGDLAAQKAGVMKQNGKLFYLVPKK